MRSSWFETDEVSTLFARYSGRDRVCFEGIYESPNHILPMMLYPFKDTRNFLPSYGYPSLAPAADPDKFLSRLSEALHQAEGTAAFVPVQAIEGSELHTQVADREDFGLRLPSYCINLEQDLGAIRSRVSRRRRSKLEPRAADGIEFLRDKSKLIPLFTRYYSQTMQRQGAHGRFSFDQDWLAGLCDLDSCELLGVCRSGNVELVLFFGVRGRDVDFVFSGSSDAGRSLATVAMWQAIKEFHRRSFRTFHMGGGMAANDGLDDFKRQFGGQRHRKAVSGLLIVVLIGSLQANAVHWKNRFGLFDPYDLPPPDAPMAELLARIDARNLVVQMTARRQFCQEYPEYTLALSAESLMVCMDNFEAYHPWISRTSPGTFQRPPRAGYFEDLFLQPKIIFSVPNFDPTGFADFQKTGRYWVSD